ncbi:MAG TPA: GSU2403 family nucleotidyltransferase fold protein [Thermoanaerobaculia bacterium]|jgi:hypothetical protein|nr:GSU2403 family nucleotidyltransferase fold protein [Thermoanaerobaculia bacterium]
MPRNDLEHFARLVDALRPFLDRLLIIGGWACRLYRYRSEASIPAYPPLFTEDADVAIPTGTTWSESLRDRLLRNGFAEEFLGEDHPPVTHYRLGEEASVFYAEFLTPLVGGRGQPGRTSQDTTEIAGVVAQKLRYLDVLMIEPWRITLDDRALNHRADIRVPNAVCYIAQKLLIHKQRASKDRAKDVLYIHDTIELFGASLDGLQELWLKTIRPRLTDRIVADVERVASELCHEVTDAIRSAALEAVSTGRALNPEAIQVVCEEGLRRIFRDRVY